MAFAQELWRSIGPIYAAILRHPFVRGLTDGSLPRESFRFYAVQDALYLREFARAGSPDPLYARWIATYASKEFGDVVGAVIDATERTAARLGLREREAMARHFVTTSRYEWMFWEMGHRREAWPL